MVIQLQYRKPAAPTLPVELPLSKSMALRAMILNAVSRRCGGGEAQISALPDASDVEGLQRALRCYEEGGGHMVNIGEGGAPLRFFTALAASTPGMDLSVTGSRGLCRRPLQGLLDTLRDCGADIRSLRHIGYPPLQIHGALLEGGHVEMNAGVSSQFISAVMMAAPLWREGLDLEFTGGRIVSRPYIEMTVEMMRRYGAGVRLGMTGVRVASGGAKAPETVDIETDWSAASYFYELALLLPGQPIKLIGLTPPHLSIQGDARCAEIYGKLGVTTRYHSDGSATLESHEDEVEALRRSETPLELDLTAVPDLVPALAAGLPAAGIKYRFTGIGHLRHKESNRLLALANEMERVGYGLMVTEDSISWEGARTPVGENEVIATYADHRMAMALAPLAVKMPYLAIDTPDVVEKSFPGYWGALERLGFSLRMFGRERGKGETLKRKKL